MRSSSVPNRRFNRHTSPYAFKGPRIGGFVKVAIMGTCTYLICKKLLHTGHANTPPSGQNAPLAQPPGTRYPYQGQMGYER